MRTVVTGATRGHQRIRLGQPRFARPRSELPPGLLGPDAVAFLVLSRIKMGAVTRYAGRYYDRRQPFPQYQLAALYFDGLRAARWVAIRRDRHDTALETVALTAAGRAYLGELIRRRQHTVVI